MNRQHLEQLKRPDLQTLAKVRAHKPGGGLGPWGTVVPRDRDRPQNDDPLTLDCDTS